MSRTLIITVLLLTTLPGSGCTPSRTMSRRDYEESRDPFMEGSRLADSAESRAAGVASLDAAPSTESNSANATIPSQSLSHSSLAGPKPIQQTSGIKGSRAAGSGIAHAAYPEAASSAATDYSAANAVSPATVNQGSSTSPGTSRSWQGPALSGFLSGRDVPASENIDAAAIRNRSSASSLSSTAGSLGSSTGRASSLSAGGSGAVSDGRRLSPAAEAAALSEMNQELGGFSSFLEKSSSQAAATGSLRAEETAAGISETAGNFSDFAARKRAEWAAQTRTAQADAKKTAAEAAAGVSSDAGRAARSASNDFFEQLAVSSNTDRTAAANAPTAVVPKNKTTTAEVPSSTPEPAQAAESAAQVGNPFEDLPDFDSTADESAAEGESLDDGFSGQPGPIPAGFAP